MSHQGIVLGAIADDFTGATDLANNLVRGGMRCLQVIGVPQEAVDLHDVEHLPLLRLVDLLADGVAMNATQDVKVPTPGAAPASLFPAGLPESKEAT